MDTSMLCGYPCSKVSAKEVSDILLEVITQSYYTKNDCDYHLVKELFAL